MEAVGDIALGGKADHRVHHISTTGHDEAYALGALKYLSCSFDEVFTALLHGDTPKEGDYFVLHTTAVGESKDRGSKRSDGIVYRRDFRWILMILLDHCPTGQVTHGDDMVCVVHPIHLDTEDCRIDIPSATVEVGSMNVYDQRLPCDLLGMNTCGVSQPVMRVDDIEGL